MRKKGTVFFCNQMDDSCVVNEEAVCFVNLVVNFDVTVLQFFLCFNVMEWSVRLSV